MNRRWVLVLAMVSLAASVALVDAAGSGAHGSTVGTNVKVWIGLKNSDDVGTSFDLKAEVTKGPDEGYGTLSNFSGGSSGFNNAHPATIPVNYSGSVGGSISVTLFVRVSCQSRHTSGTARLWWNDAAADSRVEDTGFGIRYLTGATALSSSAGLGPKMTKDVLVKKNGCAVGGDGGTWQSFGTWTGSLPVPATCTTLAAAVAVGSTNIKVTSVSGFVAGATLNIGAGAGAESDQISSVGTASSVGAGITLTAPLANAHPSGTSVCQVAA